MSHQKPSSLNQAASNLLAALITENTLAIAPKGAMTVQDFATKINRSHHTAKAILEKSKLRRGIFKGPNGKATTFYY